MTKVKRKPNPTRHNRKCFLSQTSVRGGLLIRSFQFKFEKDSPERALESACRERAESGADGGEVARTELAELVGMAELAELSRQGSSARAEGRGRAANNYRQFRPFLLHSWGRLVKSKRVRAETYPHGVFKKISYLISSVAAVLRGRPGRLCADPASFGSRRRAPRAILAAANKCSACFWRITSHM